MNKINDFYYEGKFKPYKTFVIKSNTKNKKKLADVVGRNLQFKKHLKQELNKSNCYNIKDKNEGLEIGLVATNKKTNDKRYIKFGLKNSSSDEKNNILKQKKFNKEKKLFLKIKHFFDDILHYTNDDGTSLFADLSISKYQPQDNNKQMLNPPIIVATAESKTDVYDLDIDDEVTNKSIINSFSTKPEQCINYIKPFFVNLFGIRDIRNSNIVSNSKLNSNGKYNVKIIDLMSRENNGETVQDFMLNLLESFNNDDIVYDKISKLIDDTIVDNNISIKNKELYEINKGIIKEITLRANEIAIYSSIHENNKSESVIDYVCDDMNKSNLQYFLKLMAKNNNVFLTELQTLVNKVSKVEITSNNAYFIESFYTNINLMLDEISENIIKNSHKDYTRQQIKNMKTQLIKQYFLPLLKIQKNILDITIQQTYMENIDKSTYLPDEKENLSKTIVGFFKNLQVARHKNAIPIEHILYKKYDIFFPKIGESKILKMAQMESKDKQTLKNNVKEIINNKCKQYEVAVLKTKDSWGNRILKNAIDILHRVIKKSSNVKTTVFENIKKYSQNNKQKAKEHMLSKSSLDFFGDRNKNKIKKRLKRRRQMRKIKTPCIKQNKQDNNILLLPQLNNRFSAKQNKNNETTQVIESQDRNKYIVDKQREVLNKQKELIIIQDEKNKQKENIILSNKNNLNLVYHNNIKQQNNIQNIKEHKTEIKQYTNQQKIGTALNTSIKIKKMNDLYYNKLEKLENINKYENKTNGFLYKNGY